MRQYLDEAYDNQMENVFMGGGSQANNFFLRLRLESSAECATVCSRNSVAIVPRLRTRHRLDQDHRATGYAQNRLSELRFGLAAALRT